MLEHGARDFGDRKKPIVRLDETSSYTSRYYNASIIRAGRGVPLGAPPPPSAPRRLGWTEH